MQKTAAVTHKRRNKKKGMAATLKNYIWDIVIGVLFLIVFNQEITGDTLHEWLALALFAGLITHIVLHWKWVVNITKRIFSPKLNSKTRWNYIVNFGMLLAFILMGVTGLMISEAIMPIFGLGNGSDFWEDLHEVASNFTLLMLGAHLLLHWKWIWTNTQKYILRQNGRKRSAAA